MGDLDMRFLTVIASILALTASVTADERIGPFVLLDDAPNAIVLAGDITGLTPLDFKKAMLKRPEADLLVLGSLGGNMIAGLVLADDVHLRGLNTYIPSEVGCYSACSYVFLAGKGRLAAGELGVHQFSAPNGGDDASAQIAVADMLQIMGRFDISQAIIDRMLRTPADDIHVFSSKEIVDYSVNKSAVDVRLLAAGLDDLPKGRLVELVAEASNDAPSETVVAGTVPDAPIEKQRTGATTIPAFAIFENLDFYGSDVAKISTPDVGECVAACMDSRQCTAITFNTTTRPSRGPNCFLKDGVGQTAVFEGAISGTFMDASRDMSLKVGKSRVEPDDVIRADD